MRPNDPDAPEPQEGVIPFADYDDLLAASTANDDPVDFAIDELDRGRTAPTPNIDAAAPVQPADPEPAPPNPEPPARLASIDAYRGFVMFLMMAEVLRLCAMAKKFPGSRFWELLCEHQTHVDWIGCSLHDLIQPSFSFLVGVALPFSIASRRAKGQSTAWMSLHAFQRAVVLTLLGVFLRSVGHDQTRWTFEDTLSQIGLGYGFLFLLGLASVRTQVIALVVILVGYWAAFAAYPLPSADFDLKAVGVSPDAEHIMTGFQAHWNKNTNIAWKFDTWFLNQFPRKAVWTHNGGGYSTLSFIPTLGTMILGLLAGGLLRAGGSRWGKVGILILAGGLALGAGYGLGMLGVCPVVKKIWTPSWTLFSGGWAFLFLAGFVLFVDLFRLRPLFYPLIVIGANSIAAYCLSHLIEDFIESSIRTHFGAEIFQAFGAEYEPIVRGAAILGVLWLILWWMYRKKLFVKI
ncbi:MAG: DUF5009 domain-containing protein [Isosphaeraceae bacterium]|nr:DUF5009 domain-containing protein [Isosphaeraceae bacterium]